ncbi:hypothetical protein ACP4OV_011802 [Aristida adscensionis]
MASSRVLLQRLGGRVATSLRGLRLPTTTGELGASSTWGPLGRRSIGLPSIQARYASGGVNYTRHLLQTEKTVGEFEVKLQALEMCVEAAERRAELGEKRVEMAEARVEGLEKSISVFQVRLEGHELLTSSRLAQMAYHQEAMNIRLQITYQLSAQAYWVLSQEIVVLKKSIAVIRSNYMNEVLEARNTIATTS